jgi:arsenate reductase-like glutaredoxin family protein
MCELTNIKNEPPDTETLERWHMKTGSYVALLNKKCQLLRAVKNRNALSEIEIKELLLSHYSYLKRPLFETENEVFAGNDSETVHRAVTAFLHAE